jgi:hypothetical protein
MKTGILIMRIATHLVAFVVAAGISLLTLGSAIA